MDGRCPICGAAVDEGVQVCPECGHDLRAGADRIPRGRLKRTGLFLVMGGIVTATTGGIMTQRYASIVGPILLIAGLTVFGFGLLLQQPG